MHRKVGKVSYLEGFGSSDESGVRNAQTQPTLCQMFRLVEVE